MNGRYIKRYYNGKVMEEYNIDGAFAFKDRRGLVFNCGDVVQIEDSYGCVITSFIIPYDDDYAIQGCEEYTIGGFFDTYVINNVKILKKYYELKTGDKIEKFSVQVDKYNINDMLAMSKERMTQLLPLQDKLSLLELEIDTYFNKIETLTDEDKKELTRLSQKFEILRQQYNEINWSRT